LSGALHGTGVIQSKISIDTTSPPLESTWICSLVCLMEMPFLRLWVDMRSATMLSQYALIRGTVVCHLIQHLYTGTDLCAGEVHFFGGQALVAKMVKRRCHVMRISYEPLANNDGSQKRKILVMFEGQHNHPPLPQHKLTHAAKRAVNEVFEAAGDGGITAGRLLNGR